METPGLSPGVFALNNENGLEKTDSHLSMKVIAK
jgi:hypothetical protein